MVVKGKGEQIQPILQYLKFEDNSGTARNTLRAYSYHLKLYFDFLEQENIDYR